MSASAQKQPIRQRAGGTAVTPAQTFEADTDEYGNIRLADTVHLPAFTKVYVFVSEQTTRYADIVPEADTVSHDTMRFPSVRVLNAALAKRLVKTIVEDAHAEL